MESKEPNLLAEQFQRVAKQEKFISEERKKIEEAKKAFESDKQEVDKYRKLKEKDPFEILEHFGVTYEKLLEADKNRRTTPIDPIAKKALEEVERLRVELEGKQQEAQKEKLSRAEIKLMADIDTTVKAHEFDLIEKLGEQSAVRDYMEEMFAQTGEIPDVKDACEAVTNSLVEMISKVKDSKWLKPKEEVHEVLLKAEVPVEKKRETLSNKMAQSSVSADKPMTEQERLKAAIVAMNSTKSK